MQCRGEYVVEGMSWRVCSGGDVVAGMYKILYMSWRICCGGYVVAVCNVMYVVECIKWPAIKYRVCHVGYKMAGMLWRL